MRRQLAAKRWTAELSWRSCHQAGLLSVSWCTVSGSELLDRLRCSFRTPNATVWACHRDLMPARASCEFSCAVQNAESPECCTALSRYILDQQVLGMQACLSASSAAALQHSLNRAPGSLSPGKIGVWASWVPGVESLTSQQSLGGRKACGNSEQGGTGTNAAL